MPRISAVLMMLCSLPALAAENPLPPEALDFELSDAQKKVLTHIDEELEPSIKAMHAACGEYPVVVRWAAFFANHDLKDGYRHPISSFVRKCGESIDGLAQACQLPQGPTIRKKLESVECRFEPRPKVPKGDSSKGAWEPLIEGTDLSFQYGDGSTESTQRVLDFLQRQFPDENKRDWEGQTLEQKKAIEHAASFLVRGLEEWKYTCKTPLPKITTELKGLEGGDPHRNKSTAVRLEDEASNYLRRCTGARDALISLCSGDLGEKAKAVTQIDCRFVDTEDGYQKGPKHCSVKLTGTVLSASCGWYQSTSHRSVCEALGGGQACIPEASEPSTPAEPTTRKKMPGDRCSSANECEFGCDRGNCGRRPTVQKKGRGEPCKHYGECQRHLSCIKGRCD